MRRVAIAVACVAALLPATAEARVPARQRFSRALLCGPSGSARVDGSLNATIEPRLRLAWAGARVRSARAVATLRGRADLGIDATAGAACELEPTPVARWNAPPLRFAAGPVPVVVVPRITLYVAADARAGGPVRTRIHGAVEATAGLRYDGRVHRIGRFIHRLSADSPRTRSSGSLSARLIPSIELLLYGQAGPRFDFGTGLELDLGPPRRLSVPVEFSAGLRLPGLEAGPVTVLSRRIPLHLSAPAASEAPLERARIEWDTPADIDLHVWDESGRHTWFRESGIPGVLLSKDDTDGFGPETLEEDPPGGRRLTYGLCYFANGGAGPTRVSVELPDAGGGVRRSEITLAARGDLAIVDGGGGGGGPAPGSGWCDP